MNVWGPMGWYQQKVFFRSGSHSHTLTEWVYVMD
jgi:hypothetical protein